MADVVRTLLALAAVVPGPLVGLVVWLLTLDRRRAVNATYAVWGRLGLAAAGIRLEIEGAEHLEAARPCVFLINHQSGVDPLLACAILRRDFVGVAKRELRRNPLLGPAMAFAGTIFLDRFDPEAAAAALAPAVATLRSGLSVALAPEGTRSRSSEPGRFKKGGFRLAMAAGVPLVPIVIRNAGDVLPRGAWVMRPATVRVLVHPPIPTAGWRPDDLDAHVAAVQRLYASTLSTSGTVLDL